MSSGTSRKRITLADATAAELTDLRFLGHPNGMWSEFLERGTFLPVCYAFGLMFVCVSLSGGGQGGRLGGRPHAQ